ncbi:MAG: sulfatase [Planctomycetota bacterium]|jgi:arylsulfatase A-like enzyme|nr:sulfatase [Planctomycetota bacterium]
MIRSIGLLVGLSLALCAAEVSKQPNIVFIMVDTLRWDHVSCYGYERETTPSWDRIASEGVRFETCIAASSWTLPSVMTMFTGLPPAIHGVHTYHDRLPEAATTLAEVLSSAGYQTAAFVSNPTMNAKFGFGQGFQHYDDYSVFLTGAVRALPDLTNDASAHGLRATGASISAMGLRWLRSARDANKPFFLLLGYFDPHADYEPPPPYDTRFTDPAYTGTVDGRGMYGRRKPIDNPADRQHIRDLYDGEILYTDHQIARVLTALDTLELTNNTIVVMISDHGEEFWDHGGLLHGHTLFDELVRVPFVMRYPGVIPAGALEQGLSAHADVMPTLLSLTGNSAAITTQGQDLSRRWRDRPPATVDVTFSDTRLAKGGLFAIRNHQHKLVSATKGEARLFSLASGSDEAVEATDISARLAAQLALWTASCEAAKLQGEERTVPTKLDPETMQRLRSLGYISD